MIVIIETGVGNFKSIKNMLQRFDKESILTKNVEEIQQAEHIILPGVGSFDSGINYLTKYNLVDVLKEQVLEKKTPILGICLGMQMLANSSEEGVMPGLGFIEGTVKKFNFETIGKDNKIPHMGWNYVKKQKESILIEQELEPNRFYFAHSYWYHCENDTNIIARTEYGMTFPSMIQKDNIFGVQFHPEKSHRFGMQLLKNFCKC